MDGHLQLVLQVVTVLRALLVLVAQQLARPAKNLRGLKRHLGRIELPGPLELTHRVALHVHDERVRVFEHDLEALLAYVQHAHERSRQVCYVKRGRQPLSPASAVVRLQVHGELTLVGHLLAIPYGAVQSSAFEQIPAATLFSTNVLAYRINGRLLILYAVFL